MSSHRVLKDLYKAFTSVGPGIVNDPGDAGTIEFDSYGQICEMTSGSSGETRTLKNPSRPGIPATLRFLTDGGGDVVVTAENGLNVALDTVMTFEDASDFVSLMSVTKSAGVFRWEIREGNVGPVAVSSTSPSASASTSPSASASSSPSTSPSSSPSST